MPVEMHSVVMRVEDLMSTPLDEEIVILNMVKDHYVGLDETGRAVWDLLAEPRRVDELCELLSREFDATPGEIAADVLPFLEELREEGLVRFAG